MQIEYRIPRKKNKLYGFELIFKLFDLNPKEMNEIKIMMKAKSSTNIGKKYS